MRRFLFLLALSLGLELTKLAAMASPIAEHVFIVSIDGGKPEVLARSEMPTLNRLVSEGASTWSAVTIFPSLTLPSHTSMLTGVIADKHQILWNTWKPRKGVVNVPTVFSEAKKAGLTTAMFVGKEKFRHLVQPGTIDCFEFNLDSVETNAPDGNVAKWKKRGTVPAKEVATEAARYLEKNMPNLAFIHLTDADDAGHKFGWGSPQQIAALSDVDAALAIVLAAIEAAGIADQSVIIVTADHGGHRKTHGSAGAEDMLIPWIAWGVGVNKNITISSAVATYDTSATVLWLLGVPSPSSFDGKPILAAFKTNSGKVAEPYRAKLDQVSGGPN
jgi:predicted AlkP superfamily pyrophosphatase or phosphodiesterase